MIRTFLNLFIAIALGFMISGSFEQDEILKNYSGKKELVKARKHHFDIRFMEELKNHCNEIIKIGLNKDLKYNVKLTYLNSDNKENNQIIYPIYNTYSEDSHHIIIARKGNHNPSLFARMSCRFDLQNIFRIEG